MPLTVQKHISRKFDLKNTEECNSKVENKANTCVVTNFKLSISRGSFMYRGQKLWNQIPNTLRTCKNEQQFKNEAKLWVKKNINIKP